MVLSKEKIACIVAAVAEDDDSDDDSDDDNEFYESKMFVHTHPSTAS
jgi:hypothetical protein